VLCITEVIVLSLPCALCYLSKFKVEAGWDIHQSCSVFRSDASVRY